MSSYTKEELTLVKWIIDGEEYNPATEFYKYTYAYDLDIYAKFYELNNDYTYDGSTITGYTGTDTELVIPEYVGSGNTYYKVNRIGYEAFYENYEITSVTLLDNIEYIGGRAFYKCISLVEVNLPNSLKLIEYEAFEECTSIIEIVLPDSLTELSSSIFRGCKNLVNVTLPSNLITMGSYLFAGCYNLTVVEIPNTVTTIEDGAFSDCKSLKEIILPTGLKSLGSSAFYKCYDLKSIVIPEGIKVIGSYTFYECNNLESVTLPSTLTTIIEGAFQGCYNLNKIVIPSSVKVIGDYTFSHCYNLSIFLNTETIPSTWSENWKAYTDCKIYLKDTWHYEEDIPVGNEYTITYDADGGELDNYTKVVTYNDIIELPTPTKLGYVFDGWLLNGEYYGKDSIKYTVGNDITLVALWSEAKYTITYYANGGELENYYQSVTYGKAFELPTPTRTGYTFIGWYLNGTLYNANTYEFANDISLHASWIANQYTITYDVNGGSMEDVTQVVRYEYYTELYIPSRTGYTFNGWYLNGVLYTNEYYLFDYDITLVASWTPNSYYIHYNLDGGDLDENYQVVTFDQEYTLPEPTKVDCIFNGWLLDGKSFGSGIYTIPNDITIYADWIDLNNDYSYEVYTENNESYAVITGYTGSDTELVIPEYVGSGYTQYMVKKIGQEAFINNINITSVVIPEGVKYIENYTFSGCTSLTSVTLPSTLEEIRMNAFNLCTGLENINLSSTSLTFIGEYAFASCVSLTIIELPNSVLTIEQYAFSNCTSLTSVQLSTSLNELSKGLFRECTSLTNIIIPESVTVLNDNAFSNCTSLTSIIIPNGVTSIGFAAFSNCNALASITLPFVGQYADGSGKTHFGYIFGAQNSNYNVDDVPISLKEVIITNSDVIYSNAFFYCSSLTSITIPDSVTHIGFNAFFGCNGLTSFTLPDTLISIGSSAFAECNKLSSITIPEGITIIESGVFNSCYKLTSVTLPNTLTSISAGAFIDCRNLQTINIPESITSIGKSAFFGCWSLTSIEIPEGVTRIESDTFRACSSLTSVVIPESVTYIDIYAFYGCSSLTSIVIPEGLTSIKDYVFYNCSSLTIVVIPESVTSIGERAFYNCSSLTYIVIPEGVTSIGLCAFQYCDNLTIYCEVASLPSGWDSSWNSSERPVYYAGEWIYSNGLPRTNRFTITFDANGGKMENYTIVVEYGDAVELVEPTRDGCDFLGWYYNDELFDDSCYLYEEDIVLTAMWKVNNTPGLEYEVNGSSATVIKYTGTDTEIVIPSTISIDGVNYTVTTIGDRVFYGKNIVSVELPETITTIEEYAFTDCELLENINLPDSLTTIGAYAFHMCYSLTSVVIPEGITLLDYNVFHLCSGLKSVTLPSTLKTIRNDVFRGCTSLTKLVIPEGVEVLGPCSISNCTSLKEITLPSTLITIDREVFYGCTSLRTVTIPNNATSLGNYAFEYCNNLLGVYVPSSVTTMGYDVFKYCNSLNIYCMASGPQAGWHADWNSSNRPVYYNQSW